MHRSNDVRAGLTPGNISDRAQCGKRPSWPISSGNLMNELTSAQERVLACLRGYRQASPRDQEAIALFEQQHAAHRFPGGQIAIRFDGDIVPVEGSTYGHLIPPRMGPGPTEAAPSSAGVDGT